MKDAELDVGGVGWFWVDEIQIISAASWPVAAGFESISADSETVRKAEEFVGSQQQPNGLLKSWKEELADFSWL